MIPGEIPEWMSQMLIPVAQALGDEFFSYVAFVGGTTTALLITDPFTRQAIRFTEDVDLIIKVDGHSHWQSLQKQLRQRGFKESPDDDVICRMRLGNLKVDFMPDDERILCFTNRWYHSALAAAQPYVLTDQITINLLAPVYFVATKLEAYRGRGNNDPLHSHDLEDIINLVDGREELINEIVHADGEVCAYIAQQFALLLQHHDFEYALHGNVGNADRATLVMHRFETIIELAKYRAVETRADAELERAQTSEQSTES